MTTEKSTFGKIQYGARRLNWNWFNSYNSATDCTIMLKLDGMVHRIKSKQIKFIRHEQHYNLRRRSNHNLQLPIRTTTLNDGNFLIKT